eukprot:scaffold7983_cov2262-Pinguiococcus_pyrenoidosus.AAC.1
MEKIDAVLEAARDFCCRELLVVLEAFLLQHIEYRRLRRSVKVGHKVHEHVAITVPHLDLQVHAPRPHQALVQYFPVAQ